VCWRAIIKITKIVCLPDGKIVSEYVYSLRHNTRTWRTDRHAARWQTDMPRLCRHRAAIGLRYQVRCDWVKSMEQRTCWRCFLKENSLNGLPTPFEEIIARSLTLSILVVWALCVDVNQWCYFLRSVFFAHQNSIFRQEHLEQAFWSIFYTVNVNDILAVNH